MRSCTTGILKWGCAGLIFFVRVLCQFERRWFKSVFYLPFFIFSTCSGTSGSWWFVVVWSPSTHRWWNTCLVDTSHTPFPFREQKLNCVDENREIKIDGCSHAEGIHQHHNSKRDVCIFLTFFFFGLFRYFLVLWGYSDDVLIHFASGGSRAAHDTYIRNLKGRTSTISGVAM